MGVDLEDLIEVLEALLVLDLRDDLHPVAPWETERESQTERET